MQNVSELIKLCFVSRLRLQKKINPLVIAALDE